MRAAGVLPGRGQRRANCLAALSDADWLAILLRTGIAGRAIAGGDVRDRCRSARIVGAAMQSARAGHIAVFHYERRRPEDTTLYQVVQEELDTFLAQVEAHTVSSLPQFVKDEFETFLKCGILAHGFLRLRCAECAHGKLIALSCKRRGFCPSCGARRMAE